MRVFVSPVLLGLVVMMACELDVDYFSDYAGVNLIPHLDFSTSSGEWRLLTNSADPPVYDDDHMLFEQVATPGPLGANAFRLEIKNLFPNGDFEFPLDPFWTASGGSFSIVNADVLTGPFPNMQRRIDGPTLKIVTQALDQWVGFDIDAAHFGPAILPGASFLIRFDYRVFYRLYIQYFRSSGGNYYDHQTINRGVGLADSFQNDETLPQVLAFPADNLMLPFTIQSSSTHRFNFGFNSNANNPQAPTLNSQVVMVDNVRLFRTDIDPWIEAQVPSLTSTALPLLPGIYELTFWVRREDSTNVSPNNPPTHTRFRASGVTAQIQAQVAQGIRTVTQYFPDPGWTDWAKLTVRIENVQFDSATFDPNSPAIRIRFSPTKLDGGLAQRDTGSLLLSRVELFFKER